jgi:hypothetical protein
MTTTLCICLNSVCQFTSHYNVELTVSLTLNMWEQGILNLSVLWCQKLDFNSWITVHCQEIGGFRFPSTLGLAAEFYLGAVMFVLKECNAHACAILAMKCTASKD